MKYIMLVVSLLLPPSLIAQKSEDTTNLVRIWEILVDFADHPDGIDDSLVIEFKEPYFSLQTGQGGIYTLRIESHSYQSGGIKVDFDVYDSRREKAKKNWPLINIKAYRSTKDSWLKTSMYNVFLFSQTRDKAEFWPYYPIYIFCKVSQKSNINNLRTCSKSLVDPGRLPNFATYQEFEEYSKRSLSSEESLFINIFLRDQLNRLERIRMRK